MSDDAVRVVAAVMAFVDLAVVTLVWHWERPGRLARLRTPVAWRVPRLGTVVMVLPLAYPVVAVIAPGWLAWRSAPLLHAAGIVLWGTGLAGVLWCVRVMRGQTGADGIVEGHRLVTTGPYHFVRHPMYAAVLTASVGIAIALGSLVTALLVLVFVPVAVSWARTEDRLLEASDLGERFRDYERRTGRLLPRLRKH